MPSDKSLQLLLRQALCTCGTNENVVSVPAANPNNVIQGVISSLVISSLYPATSLYAPAAPTPRGGSASSPDSAPPAQAGCSPDAQNPHPPYGPGLSTGRPSSARR